MLATLKKAALGSIQLAWRLTEFSVWAAYVMVKLMLTGGEG